MFILIHYFLPAADYKKLIAWKTGNLDIQMRIIEVSYAN
jgi:hypothetical protein